MSDTPLRHCSRCETDKPIDAFRARRRPLMGGGVTIYWETVCKPCLRRPTARQRLPVEPFREWVIDRWEVYGSLAVLAELCGVPQRTLWRVRFESARVNLDTVDRCLCGEGSTSLAEMYPCDDVAVAA